MSSSNPELTLTYFNMRGRAEIVRLLLKEANIEFTDERLEKEQWLERKPNTPMGSLPVLTVGSGDSAVTIPDSLAIGRYVAVLGGLHGDNEVEAARLDGYVFALMDIAVRMMGLAKAKDDPEAVKGFMEFLAAKLPFHEKALEAHGGTYGGKDDAVSYPDVVAYYLFWLLGQQIPTLSEVLKPFPLFSALLDTVAQRPNIAKWVAERPETAM